MTGSVLPFMKKMEAEILDEFNNQDKSADDKHYGENFKEHDLRWWMKIKANMNLPALFASEYHTEQRAISVNNTYARSLPDLAPDFLHASLPGQGFPFDNLQDSAIWAGTPLYVFGVSNDRAWSLVFTPDGYFSWVKSHDIAYVSPGFIRQWQEAARHRLVAITRTEVPVVDTAQQFQFSGYVGAVFPMIQRDSEQTAILIPVKNQGNQAMIKIGIIDSRAANPMPLAASPKNLVGIINQLKNRPYGWGGNFFFNDCSQEMKSLFTPLGIWLPRNSAQQSRMGTPLNLANSSVDERIAILKEKGHGLMTIIYIGGHVMLYIGNKDGDAITYQNVWGMSPENRDKRYVIGQSLFFPLLKQYPEIPEVSSLASHSAFKLVYLDELPVTADSPPAFAGKIMAAQPELH